jgi:integrase
MPDVQLVPTPAFRGSRSKPDNQAVRSTTEGGKARTVPLPAEVAALVSARLNPSKPDSLIFPNATGGFLHGGIWKREVRWSGLNRGPRIHDLRHTTETIWLAIGIDLKTAQTRLGHSTARLTADTYAHWMGSDTNRAALDRIYAALAPRGTLGRHAPDPGEPESS